MQTRNSAATRRNSFLAKRGALCLGISWLTVLATIAAPVVAEPSPEEARVAAERTKTLDRQIEEFTRQLEQDPQRIELYSQRGDAQFFRGRFADAVADYEKMVELEPKLETSHWRRGIAYFYAGQFKDAAHQFEIYHTFDDVDRENGIWRFFSQAKAYGVEKAREGLLKYRKDDREPFPALYGLFAGTITAEEILKTIHEAKLDADEREKRLFYAELYIGLNEAVTGDPQAALPPLRRAVANTWGPKAGYGPHYMWQVGRLQLELLEKQRATRP